MTLPDSVSEEWFSTGAFNTFKRPTPIKYTSWGNLQYKAGEDFIVRHGLNDYGVVKKDIFTQTYDQSSR